LQKIEAPGDAQRLRRAAAQFGRNPARSGASRSPSVDRGIEGKEVGEEAWCPGAGERKTDEMRDNVRRRLFMAARRCERGGKGKGIQLGAAWGQEREQRRGAGCGDLWAGMAWARWLRAAWTAVGGARHADAAGALRTGEAEGARATWARRLTCGAGRRRAQWSAVVCKREWREQGSGGGGS
jgi:hypothetical protein